MSPSRIPASLIGLALAGTLSACGAGPTASSTATVVPTSVATAIAPTANATAAPTANATAAPTTSAAAVPTSANNQENVVTTASGLKYIEITPGTGNAPKVGDMVSVHYRGTLENGTVFDSSYERNQPIQFALGRRMVIPGWDEGIALMRKGGKAKLIIPPNLAYGTSGAGGVIPPNATLTFEVELVDIK